MIAIFPKIAQCAAAGDVERLAVMVRRYYGGDETFAPRPDVGRLLAAVGLGMSRLALDTLGALLAKDERGAFTIVAVISDRTDDDAARFLLAHMLGHYLLDIQPLIASGDWQVSGYRESVCPLKRYSAGGMDPVRTDADARRDGRADRFAAALLLPHGMVRRALEKIQDPERVAAFFGVTRGCLTRRLQELGLAAALPVNFLDAERRTQPEPVAETPQPALVAPEGGMPRSYAASTYGATEKATGRRAPAAPKAPPKPAPKVAAPAQPVASGDGMERLRAIARKLDRGVAKP